MSAQFDSSTVFEIGDMVAVGDELCMVISGAQINDGLKFIFWNVITPYGPAVLQNLSSDRPQFFLVFVVDAQGNPVSIQHVGRTYETIACGPAVLVGPIVEALG